MLLPKERLTSLISTPHKIWIYP